MSPAPGASSVGDQVFAFWEQALAEDPQYALAQAGLAKDPEPTAQRLFHIERNKNANIVVYDARVMPDSSLADEDPMVVYWIKEAEDNRIEDLKGIERRMAYGFKIEERDGNLLEGANEGNLVITDSWPGQMRTVYGDHKRFVETYFSTFDNCYTTGDGARRDEDGYYWITGRVDDVLNVSGHRMGTAEIESALVAHSSVAEAAVVGYPHDIKGQGIYAYVTLMEGVEPSDELRAELQQWVRKDIGPIAKPDLIQWAPGLPKTRSGKIMRRILRKVAADDYAELGDTSTLADPAVVDDLIANRQNRA